jgi:hypothetical protein
MVDEKDEDIIFVGCMTVQMGRWSPGSIVPNCVVKQCCDCNTDIHVSPSSQKLLAENEKSKEKDVRLICIPCLKKKAQEAKTKGEPAMFMGVVPGSIEEVKAEIERRKEENK